MNRLRDLRFSALQIAFLEARTAYARSDWKTALEGFKKVRPQLNDFPQLMKCLRLLGWLLLL